MYNMKQCIMHDQWNGSGWWNTHTHTHSPAPRLQVHIKHDVKLLNSKAFWDFLSSITYFTGLSSSKTISFHILDMRNSVYSLRVVYWHMMRCSYFTQNEALRASSADWRSWTLSLMFTLFLIVSTYKIKEMCRSIALTYCAQKCACHVH